MLAIMKCQVLHKFVIHCTQKFINVFDSAVTLALCWLLNKDGSTSYMSKGVTKAKCL